MHRRTACLALCAAAGAMLWPTRASGRADPPRATWLWNPGPMLNDAGAQAAFLDFLEHERITVVWAQVGTSGQDLTSAPQWRALIAAASARRISVEALDGAPTYAIEEAVPKRLVEAVLAYNETAKANERFGGIHLDIEPHLLWTWRFPQRRQLVLRQYLELLDWCRRRIDNEFPGMKLGVDIPFWWQAADGRSGRAIGDVTFRGVTKAASFHVIDLVDNVGIMNYRNRAGGANGLIALGEDLLAYADRVRKAALWMAVETSRDEPVPVWFVIGLPKDLAETALDSADISPDHRYRGFKLSAFDDGASLHVGLSLGGLDPARPSAPFLEAMAQLARTVGVLSRPGPPDRADQALARATRSFSANPEWQSPVSRTIVDPGGGKPYPGVIANAIMLPILTFEGLPPEVFRREVAAAEAAFSTHASYRGLAIHHYESYRRLVKGTAPTRPLLAQPPFATPRY